MYGNAKEAATIGNGLATIPLLARVGDRLMGAIDTIQVNNHRLRGTGDRVFGSDPNTASTTDIPKPHCAEAMVMQTLTHLSMLLEEQAALINRLENIA